MEVARAKETKLEEKGDPRFNLNDAKPTAIYTDEDAALDRELDRLAAETAPIATIDPDVQPVQKTKDRAELLSDVMDVSPASTVNELMDQVHQAKEHGCDSIYATETMIKHYNRKGLPTDVGYFIFHNIKVYLNGHFEQASKRDKMSIQEKVFGLPKADAK